MRRKIRISKKKLQQLWTPDSRADTTKKSADTSTDTAKCGLQTQKGGRYGGRYAKYRDFQYLALSGEYLRICSCIFHWFSAMKPLDDKQHCNIKAIPFFVCVSGLK